MSENTVSTEVQKVESVKKIALAVYICQVLAFVLAGLPLLIGVALNFWKRREAEGTWVESHFDWQIQTVWVVLAGFALAGLTFETGVGLFILLPTVLYLVYRIVLGWNALTADRPINPKNPS